MSNRNTKAKKGGERKRKEKREGGGGGGGDTFVPQLPLQHTRGEKNVSYKSDLMPRE